MNYENTIWRLIMWASFLSCGSRNSDKSDIVYICTGSKAKVYHKYKDCRGLDRCSGSIKEISLDEAKKIRRPCKICY